MDRKPGDYQSFNTGFFKLISNLLTREGGYVISPTDGSKLSRLLEKYRLLSGEMNLLKSMNSGQDAGMPTGAQELLIT